MKYIDTEKVIAAVRQRPLLWKRKHELYKDRDERENAWREVSNDVLPDYETFSTAEKEDSGRRIQQRWRTARDTYIKVKFAEDSRPPRTVGRRGQSAAEDSRPPGSKGSKKKYAYYDILSFLDGAGRRVKRRHYETNDESSVDDSTVEASMNSAPSPSTSAPPPPEPAKRTKRKKKELKTTAKQIDKSTDKSNDLELEKEDLAFFQSLQPTLKRFSNYQRMLFRTKVIQVIMEMESPHVHEVDVASSPGSTNKFGHRVGQYDPMSCTVTIKSEVEPSDDSESD